MGYMHPSSRDEQHCVDIEECDMFDNLCVFGRCENTQGGFECICDPGYILDNTGGNCTGSNIFSFSEFKSLNLLKTS